MRNLKKLELNSNDLYHLPDEAFENLIDLKDLDLSDNHLYEISHEVLKPLIKLEVLCLDNNKLRKLDAISFKNQIQLKYLHVSNNLIDYIDEDFKDVLINIKQIDASSNICVNQTFRNVAKDLKGFRVSYWWVLLVKYFMFARYVEMRTEFIFLQIFIFTLSFFIYIQFI